MIHQGKKSEVSAETIDGELCIRKQYNDNGNPRDKCLRETAFYNCYAGVPGLPRLIADSCPTHIVIEYVQGEPLSVWHRGKSEKQLDELSRAYGRHIGLFLLHEPASATMESIRREFPGDTSLATLADRMFAALRSHLKAEPAFDLPALHRAVEKAGDILALSGFWGEEALCKLDWNAGNTIVASDGISGFVDFEQSFFGNRAVFVGTVIDHINVLRWSEVRKGIESARGPLPSVDVQYSAACFSMCYKILGACRNGEITYFTPERLLWKFEDMRRTIERAEHAT